MLLPRNTPWQKYRVRSRIWFESLTFSPLFRMEVFTDWKVKPRGASLPSLGFSPFWRVHCVEDKQLWYHFPFERQNNQAQSVHPPLQTTINKKKKHTCLHPIDSSLLKHTTPELWYSGLYKSHFLCEAPHCCAMNAAYIGCDWIGKLHLHTCPIFTHTLQYSFSLYLKVPTPLTPGMMFLRKREYNAHVRRHPLFSVVGEKRLLLFSSPWDVVYNATTAF